MTTAAAIIAEHAARAGLTVRELLEPRRLRRLAWPRQDAIRDVWEKTGLKQDSIAHEFGVTRATVIYSIRASEARANGTTYRPKPSTAGKRA